MKTLWFIVLTGLLLPGCNWVELERVKSEMENNVATAKEIEKLQQQLVVDFKNARVFYEAMEKKLYVTGIKNEENGNYSIIYSDGSELHLSGSETPVVSFAPDGEVIINNVPTGCRPVDGDNGYAPEIMIGADGYYYVDGVKTTLLKGKDGVEGETPQVWIDADGYYCVGDGRVEPEICLKGQDGTPSVAPVPTIVEMRDGSYELWIDGKPTVPSTVLTLRNGADGAVGIPGGNYIKNVTLSVNNELIFTFSDGSTQKSSPVSFNDLVFELQTNDLTNVPIGKSFRIKYTVRTDYATNAVSVNQMYGLKGWQVLIDQPDPLTKEGYVTVTPVGGLSASGSLMLMVIDEQQRTVVQEVRLSLQSYQIDIPTDFSKSYVYDVYTPDGIKIAEVCREYINGTVGTMSVVYACTKAEDVYSRGYVVNNGGYIIHNGQAYEPGVTGMQNWVKLESGEVGKASGVMSPTLLRPKVLVDYDGNNYPIVKIGTDYWMAENLKVKHYRTGRRILPKPAVNGNLIAAYYEPDEKYSGVYGLLYNGLVATDELAAPEGWHIPSMSEFQRLSVYGGVRLKSEKTGINVSAGEWKPSSNANVKGTNETCFSALPGGYWTKSDLLEGVGEFAWFWAKGSGESIYLPYSRSLVMLDIIMPAEDYHSVRCIKD